MTLNAPDEEELENTKGVP